MGASSGGSTSRGQVNTDVLASSIAPVSRSGRLPPRNKPFDPRHVHESVDLVLSAVLHRNATVALAFGLTCHILFVLGVGTMMVAMFFGMNRSMGRLGGPWGGVADGILLLQFPLVHSVLLSRRGRRWMARLAPFGLGGKLSTTIYAAIASLQVWMLFALWTPSGIVWWRAHGPALVVMCVCYAAAWMLLLRSIVDAGFPLQVGLLGWWAVARNKPPVYPPMPRRGLFRLCRQPIYLAFALTLWTAPTLTPDQLCVALVLTAYCVLGPLLKEARFRRVFGAEFDEYRSTVPYFLPRLPLPRCDRPPEP